VFVSIPLEETPLFKLLGPERLAQIGPHVRRCAFDAREFLYHEDQPARVLWSVRSGEVRTLKGSANGRVTTLESLYPGDLFGLAAMSDGAHYSETAQGVAAGELWKVPRSAVASLLDADPELSRGLLAIVAGRLKRAHERLFSFAQARVPERLARAVLESAEDGEVQKTRQLLGESAGTTVETAIRVLRRFERAGWIEGGIGRIHVVDAEALERVASGEELVGGS
jgi:CRP/FNR family transcriptional regulator